MEPPPTDHYDKLDKGQRIVAIPVENLYEVRPQNQPKFEEMKALRMPNVGYRHLFYRCRRIDIRPAPLQNANQATGNNRAAPDKLDTPAQISG